MARTPYPFLMSDPKPRDVFRIVILGESAAFGTPDPAFGFGRILEAMLRRRFPRERFEVINAAMVAINSHAILPIVGDCARAGVDLFIAYIGHNEVVGPFGAGTVFGGFTENLSSIRAGLWLRTTALGQGIAGLVDRFRSSGSAGGSEWRGMEFFVGSQVPAGDPRLEGVYRHFERNLADIRDAAVSRGAGIILCTTACNLRDCAPFASQHRTGLTAVQEAEWERACEQAELLSQAGRWSEAERAYREALRLDDRYADAHFKIARCYAALGDRNQARAHYRMARDLDCLRFRADSRMNETVRRVAQDGRESVTLVDAESKFDEASGPAGIVPGGDYFYEHVHLRIQGNYLLARSLWPEVVRWLPASARGSGSSAGDPPSLDECSETLALSDWDRYRMIEEIMAIVDGPPFTQQLDHEEQMGRLRRELRQLEGRRSPAVFTEAIARYRGAVAAAPGDLTLRRRFGGLLTAAGHDADAVDAWRSVLREMPDDAEATFQLGCLYSAMGKASDAAAQFARVVSLPESKGTELAAKAHYNWGNLLRSQNKTQGAIEHYRASLACRPDYVPTLNNLGSTLLLTDTWDEAIDYFRRALKLDPKRVSARRNLAYALARKGLMAEAATEYREALRVDPRDDEAKRQLELLEARIRSVPTPASQRP